MLAALVLSLSAAAPAAGATPGMLCKAPRYSAEALRYQMQGTALVVFDAAGKPALGKSSGYGLLDQASLALAARCAPEAGGTSSMEVPWTLPPGTEPDRAPLREQQFCHRINKIIGFVDLDDPRRNITVRALVWPDGTPFSSKIEQSSGEALADAQALEMVDHCRFKPALRAGAPTEGAVLVALALDKEAIAPARLRATYEKLLEDKYLVDFKLAHIALKDEAAARAAITALSQGGNFAALARARSVDAASARVDGELGWMRASRMESKVADAIINHGKLGVLPDPVRRADTWHVIQVNDKRASTVPTFAEMSATIKRDVIEAREIVVQQPPPAATTNK